eukprot:878081-Amphidinium_carterae.1
MGNARLACLELMTCAALEPDINCYSVAMMTCSNAQRQDASSDDRLHHQNRNRKPYVSRTNTQPGTYK